MSKKLPMPLAALAAIGPNAYAAHTRRYHLYALINRAPTQAELIVLERNREPHANGPQSYAMKRDRELRRKRRLRLRKLRGWH